MFSELLARFRWNRRTPNRDEVATDQFIARLCLGTLEGLEFFRGRSFLADRYPQKRNGGTFTRIRVPWGPENPDTRTIPERSFALTVKNGEVVEYVEEGIFEVDSREHY